MLQAGVLVVSPEALAVQKETLVIKVEVLAEEKILVNLTVEAKKLISLDLFQKRLK